MQLAKKWPEMGSIWPFMSHKFSVLFLTKLQKTGNEKIVFYVVAFDPNKI